MRLNQISTSVALLLTTMTVLAAPWRNLPNNWRTQTGDPAGAEAPEFDDSSWSPASEPLFASANATGPSVWYRLKFSLPPEARGQALFLRFGMADLKTAVFFNGVKVASGRDPEGRVVATIPALLLGAGSSDVVAIKVPTGVAIDPSAKPAWTLIASELPAIFEHAREKASRVMAACTKMRSTGREICSGSCATRSSTWSPISRTPFCAAPPSAANSPTSVPGTTSPTPVAPTDLISAQCGQGSARTTSSSIPRAMSRNSPCSWLAGTARSSEPTTNQAPSRGFRMAGELRPGRPGSNWTQPRSFPLSTRSPSMVTYGIPAPWPSNCAPRS